MTCPNGHTTTATDYCDVCGEALTPPAGGLASDATPAGGPGASATPDAPGQDAPGLPNAVPSPDAHACPNCQLPARADALFCEGCGYDFTTGAMPRRGPVPTATTTSSATPASTNTAPELAAPWVAEVWIDPAWYASQQSPDPLPSAGPPLVVALRHTSLLIGRSSRSRDIHPDIDCGADNGVSRRHAQVTSDGTRWWVEDLQSSNGTFLGDAVGALPTKALPPGQKREVAADARIYLGSWTRIVLRPAEEGEV